MPGRPHSNLSSWKRKTALPPDVVSREELVPAWGGPSGGWLCSLHLPAQRACQPSPALSPETCLALTRSISTRQVRSVSGEKVA